jgi:hypothetical protein
VEEFGTTGRVFACIDPEQFQHSFLQWVQALQQVRGDLIAFAAGMCSKIWQPQSTVFIPCMCNISDAMLHIEKLDIILLSFLYRVS